MNGEAGKGDTYRRVNISKSGCNHDIIFGKEKPKLSIVTVVKDRTFMNDQGKGLYLFLNNIQSLGEFKETFDIDLVIVDNNSTDCKPENWVYNIFEHATILKVDGKTVGEARGEGCKVAKHNSVFFLDADMLIKDSYVLHRALACLRGNNPYTPHPFNLSRENEDLGLDGNNLQNIVLTKTMVDASGGFGRTNDMNMEGARIHSSLIGCGFGHSCFEQAPLFFHQWHP